MCIRDRNIVEHLRRIKSSFSRVGIVSTAYEHLARFYGPKVGIEDSDIASTKISFDDLRNEFMSGSVIKAVLDAERAMENLKEAVEEAIKEYTEGITLGEIFERDSTRPIDDVLGELYFSRLPRFNYSASDIVNVIGGDRKVDRIREVVESENGQVSDVVYVGDSITDDKAHKFVRENGGLAIAVNGDEYAIRNANVAIATEDMREIKRVTDVWQLGGMDKVRELESSNQTSCGKERGYEVERRTAVISIVKHESLKETVDIHKMYRSKIRVAAIPII